MSKSIVTGMKTAAGGVLAFCVMASVQAQTGFETPPVLNAAQLLPAQSVAGPDFKVENAVTNDGFMNHYQITSPFGKFDANSDAEAVKRVHEIGAIGKLKKLESSDEFGKGI